MRSLQQLIADGYSLARRRTLMLPMMKPARRPMVQSAQTIATLVAAGTALLFLPAALAQDFEHDKWLATWGAGAQSAAEALVGPPPAPLQFDNQTIRMIARISKGADRVRVRLDNTFGTDALAIGSAHVALHGTGPGIIRATDSVLTFGGSSTITIPSGAPALSDPVDLEIPDLGEVAVSIYLPDPTAGESVHSVGRQTAYISQAGDFTGALTIPAPTTTEMRFFLSGIEVQAGDRARSIVTLGDSLTDGMNSTLDANKRWPDRLAERLLVRRRPHLLSVVNEGISGNRVLHEVFGPDALARFDRDVIAQSRVAFVTLLLGTDDIGLSALVPSQAVTPDQIIQGYRQLIERAHVRRIKILGATLTPLEGARLYTPGIEANRQALNAFIRTSGEFDDVLDFDFVTRDPTHPTRLLPSYDSGDHIHPNYAGYKAMADSIDLRFFEER
jgi:lysophospholipase L1-like esterase